MVSAPLAVSTVAFIRLAGREKKFHLSAGLASSEFFTFEILADKDWRGTACLLSLNICEAEK